MPPLAGEVLGPEFRPALLALAKETEACSGSPPSRPIGRTWRGSVLSSSRSSSSCPASRSAALSRGVRAVSLPRVVEEALKAVRPWPSSSTSLFSRSWRESSRRSCGNPRLALSGLQTLMGWAIARSTSEPVALALFHMRSGEAVGPFTMTQAEGLPSGEWVAFSLMDSGPRLNTSELEGISDETRAHPTVSPLGAGCKQVREAGGPCLAGDGQRWIDALRCVSRGVTSWTASSSQTHVSAELITPHYRVKGKIPVSSSGVVGVLNDTSGSSIEVVEVWLARLHRPAETVARFESWEAVKASIVAVLLEQRSDLGPVP